MTPPNPVSPKVVVSTLVSLGASLLLAILNAVQANPDLLGSVPPVLQFLLLAIIPPLVTFLAGYAKADPLRTEGVASVSRVAAYKRPSGDAGHVQGSMLGTIVLSAAVAIVVVALYVALFR
jgi:hypothetical protein